MTPEVIQTGLAMAVENIENFLKGTPTIRIVLAAFPQLEENEKLAVPVAGRDSFRRYTIIGASRLLASCSTLPLSPTGTSLSGSGTA
jgi:hypothetical protein